jgi:hypothetical protein
MHWRESWHVCVGAKLALLTLVVAVVNGRLLYVSDSHIDAEHIIWFLTAGREKKSLHDQRFTE